MATFRDSCLYIIQEREFVRFREHVYKVGFSANLNQRARAYPKGSRILGAVAVRSAMARQAERMLLDILKRSTKHRPDVGAEYFEGQLHVIMTAACNVALMYPPSEPCACHDDVDDKNGTSADSLLDGDDDAPSRTASRDSAFVDSEQGIAKNKVEEGGKVQEEDVRVKESSNPSNPTREVIYEFQELFDASLTERICTSPAMKKKLASPDDGAYGMQLVETMSVAKALGGALPVSYYLDSSQEGFGRMKAEVQVDWSTGDKNKLLPYVYMQREVRGHLAAKNYWDVDMVNCQPSILLQRLDLLAIESPMLKRYVENRQECLEEIQTVCKVPRDAAKKLFLRLLYLGSPEKWRVEEHVDANIELPSWITDFSKEMHENAQALVSNPENVKLREHYRDHVAKSPQVKTTTKNPLATMLSLLLQTEERKCVCALIEAICVDQRTIGGIIHDGVHVARQEDETSVSQVLIRRWQHRIMKDTGYLVKLAVKPFELDASYLAEVVDDPWDDSFLEGHLLLSYRDLKARWEQRSFKVIQGSANYVREEKGRRHIMSEKTLQESYKHLHYIHMQTQDGSIQVTKLPFVVAWTKDALLRKYKLMMSCPPGVEVPEACYNTWDGFAAERLYNARTLDTADEPKDSEGVRAILEFVHILCNRDQEVTDYVLDWLAQIFQQPARKTEVALLLHGDQGVGKNRFTDWCTMLIGEDKCLNTSTPQTTLYGQYTNLREGKYLVVINEASSSDNMPFSNQLKDMISSPSFVCNAKYVNQNETRCYDRFIFTTNNDQVIKIENGDRRFLPIDVSSELKGRADYFARLSAIMDVADVRRDFYRHLMSRDLSRRTDWAGQRPLRVGFSNMLSTSLELEYQFIRHIVLRAEEDIEMLLDDLFEMFRTWLISNGPSNGKYFTTNLRFGHKMTKLLPNKEKPTAMAFQSIRKQRDSRGMIYRIDVQGCIKEMLARHWITMEDIPSGVDVFLA